jgi:dihydroorotase|tara:strand:+ start:16 stop:1332 length:1317 start_codon:yes stop_codon:yes gene_type:complete
MSDNYSLIIKNGSCYIEGKFQRVDIALSGNKIKKIGKIDLNSSKVLDVSGKIVLPGVIDTQVHFREPGKNNAENLETGSRAAVAGGVTSVFEMPNTNPPTSTFKEFNNKLNVAKGRMFCNYAFYFGATPDNMKELAAVNTLEGCCGVKLFAGSSTGNLLVSQEKDIEKVISNSSKIISVHSEDENILLSRKKFIKEGDVSSHPVWRNEECALESTKRVVRIAQKYKKKIHILHISTKEEIDFFADKKENVTFEITPQHLTLFAPNCYEKLKTFSQMNPPLRSKDHYDRLWDAVKESLVSTIGSDHAPHTKEDKNKKYPLSPSGMPGVQTLLPIMLDHVNKGKLKLEQLIKLVCENPSDLFGIKNKGYIKENYDADLTIVDMNKDVVIKDNWIESKCGWTPFNNYKVKGFPVATIINGEIVMENGKINKSNGKPLVFDA